MSSWPILSLMIFIPIFGAFFISLIDGEEKTIIKNTKMVALWTSLVVFILSLFLWLNFPKANGFHFIEEVNLFSAAGISNSGSSVNDTRIVSPIPSVSKVPIPNADFILPSNPSPASVTPK